MKKCLLWGTGRIFNAYANMVKYHEEHGHFAVVGVTSNIDVYDRRRGYTCIAKSDLKEIEYDFVIMMADGVVLKEIRTELLELGVAPEKIFTYKILSMEDFSIERLENLKKNPPTILSNNCWGGITYHSLDLEFTSPLINMFVRDGSYLKLLSNLRYYMETPLEDGGTAVNPVTGEVYPLGKCGDVTLHFNHASSFEEANRDWEKRKKRINWDNLFVMMYTESKKSADAFDLLPYEKKICFVPFNSDKASHRYVELCEKKGMEDVPFWAIVNGMASGTYPYYDVVDLVENANVRKIVEI